MIAVDTNVLVYAHRRDSPWHEAARRSVAELAENRSSWGIPWPCVHEFIGIVTHPRIYAPPSRLSEALDQLEAWMESPSLVLLHESEAPAYWPVLRDMLLEGKIAGPKVHDGRIAAICRIHGVRELVSADRDFSRFPSLTVRRPL